MAVYSANRLETLWAQVITDIRTIPNTSGTWTATGAIKQRYDQFTTQQINPTNSPTYKTGTSSRLIGTRGRQGATWTLEGPLIPSGAAGTAPDAAPILQSIFGAAGSVAAGVSVTYATSDALPALGLFRYNKTAGATTPTNTYIVGGLPETVTFIFNQNFMNYRVQGRAMGVADSLSFSSYALGDLVLKGALTTYPAEPGSVTQNGNVVPGFGTGVAALFGATAWPELRGTIEITMNTGIEFVDDAYNDPYPIAAMRGIRQVSLARIQCIDSDSTILNSVKTASFSKAPTNISLAVGTGAGNVMTFLLKNVQVGGYSFNNNGAALDIVFDNSPASATSTTVTDEMSLTIT